MQYGLKLIAFYNEHVTYFRMVPPFVLATRITVTKKHKQVKNNSRLHLNLNGAIKKTEVRSCKLNYHF